MITRLEAGPFGYKIADIITAAAQAALDEESLTCVRRTFNNDLSKIKAAYDAEKMEGSLDLFPEVVGIALILCWSMRESHAALEGGVSPYSREDLTAVVVTSMAAPDYVRNHTYLDFVRGALVHPFKGFNQMVKEGT